MAKLALQPMSLLAAFLALTACDAPPSEDAGIFAGLSQDNAAGAEVVRGYPIRFPHDHASHPEFAIEWWYLTANLEDESGQAYPVQWTLFRFADDKKQPPWSDSQLYMAHGKLITAEKNWFVERFARGGVGNADVTISPFGAFLDDWTWQSDSDDLFPSQLDFRLDSQTQVSLTLLRNGPYILHGDAGYSKKVNQGPQASYYYSQPFIEAKGTIAINGNLVNVSGNAWFDHEWTSQYLATDTLGWDWFSMHLEDGSKLMLFNLRQNEGEDFWSGSWVSPTGDKQHIAANQLTTEVTRWAKIENRSLPVEWRINISTLGMTLNVSPFKDDQWNAGRFSYYEGAINIDGTHQGKGFIELTGY